MFQLVNICSFIRCCLRFLAPNTRWAKICMFAFCSNSFSFKTIGCILSIKISIDKFELLEDHFIIAFDVNFLAPEIWWIELVKKCKRNCSFSKFKHTFRQTNWLISFICSRLVVSKFSKVFQLKIFALWLLQCKPLWSKVPQNFIWVTFFFIFKLIIHQNYPLIFFHQGLNRMFSYVEFYWIKRLLIFILKTSLAENG